MDLGEHLAFYYGDFLVLKVRLHNQYTIIILKPSFLTQIDSQIQYIKSLIVSWHFLDRLWHAETKTLWCNHRFSIPESQAKVLPTRNGREMFSIVLKYEDFLSLQNPIKHAAELLSMCSLFSYFHNPSWLNILCDKQLFSK